MKILKLLLAIFFIILTEYSFSQKVDSLYVQKNDTIISKKIEIKSVSKVDSTKKELYLKGGVTITNKGISYIPNLSLGKPAIIFDLSMANKRLSFEPQLRFSLNAEPWAFLFPVRYKIKSKGKFQMTAGINPLMNFKSVTYTAKGVSVTDLVNRRYLGGEFRPNYYFTKQISVGITYLYFSGVSESTVKNTNFVSFNINFSYIKLAGGFYTKFNPQLYYLNQDGKEGYYFNSVITLLKKDLPFSIQNNINSAIETNIFQ